jgi:hypothetical protein
MLIMGVAFVEGELIELYSHGFVMGGVENTP